MIFPLFFHFSVDVNNPVVVMLVVMAVMINPVLFSLRHFSNHSYKMPNKAEYNWHFKRFAMDAVLREYAAFFRVAEYMEDTRTLFLLSMCAMIDMAQNHCQLHAESGATCHNNPDSLPFVDPWDLDRLAYEDRRYFSHANWPGNAGALNDDQCYQHMLKVLRNAPFI